MKQYTVKGMSCAACSARVEKAVSKVDGVTSCSVSLLTNSMGVEGTANSEDIIAAVHKAGYEASLKSPAPQNPQPSSGDNPPEDRETPLLKKRLITSLVFLAALMCVCMGYRENNFMAQGLAELLLTGTIMVINQKFFISGFTSLWHRAPNMDTLVALGASAAFVYSTYMLFAMTSGGTYDLYFESAGMILTLITLGKLLEARSRGKTTDALKGLMKLVPSEASVIRNGKEVTVPVFQLVKGDVFIVRPGESIPVDGTVLEGISSVDESALTGESIPSDKEPGSMVSAGTINRSGYLKCEASRVGEDTTLSQIIQMVSDTAATKAPVARIADKVSGIFVPAVILIALITAAVWLLMGQTAGFALARGISVLVISCPCALGLATPVAIMVGSGRGARNGILFKTAASLENTGKAGTVVLDKTGTITAGEPKVTDLIPADGITEKQLLEIALALESKSEHPLAGAIVDRAGKECLTADDVSDFRALPGNGLTGKLKGEVLLGGNLNFISEHITVPEAFTEQAEALSEKGRTPLFFASGGRFCGIIAVADTMREDSADAIEEMRGMGLHVVMLTGDNERTAKAIGDEAGVDEVIAGVLPDEKQRVIDNLKKESNVIMVGDGINDAPALTAADTGIAIGAGTDVAIDAADVVLMRNSLSQVVSAIRLSRATLRNIHQNLFWAFIYNVLGIPLASGLFIGILGWQLSPMFAAAAMSLSSFCVVTNALRLNLVNLNNDNDIREDKKMNKTIVIESMMCGHCEMHVKKALEALDGVESASASHEDGRAVVTLNKDVDDDLLKKTVEEEGYQVVSFL
ncbi:MAG: heavy metal translocating P-type ATPase [Lentihominibacter sp.]